MTAILVALLFAWFLKLFGVAHLVAIGMLELFGIHITVGGYYVIAILMALVYNIIHYTLEVIDHLKQ